MWFELKPIVDRIESEAAAARSAKEEALRRTEAENKRAAQRKAESEIVAAIERREAEKLRKLMQSYDDTSASQQRDLLAVQIELASVRETMDAAERKINLGEYIPLKPDESVLQLPDTLGHVYNVVGSTGDRPPAPYDSWKNFHVGKGGGDWPELCSYEGCQERATLGAHGTKGHPHPTTTTIKITSTPLLRFLHSQSFSSAPSPVLHRTPSSPLPAPSATRKASTIGTKARAGCRSRVAPRWFGRRAVRVSNAVASGRRAT